MHLHSVVDRLCPQLKNSIPHPDGIDIKKFAKTIWTTDGCNAARKSRRVANERVGGGSSTQDCHNHMRNIYLGKAAERSLGRHLTSILKSSLDEIDPSLRVPTPHVQFARAYDKEFSRSANYVKGHGEFNMSWLMKNYPSLLLFHVESTHGARQDIVFTSSLAMFMNREVNMEFLDYCLSMPGKDGHILQKNLFVLLSSLEMVAQCRLLAIVYILCMMPLRWLSGNTYKLAKYNWGAVSMNRALDIFHSMVLKIIQRPALVVCQMNMMVIFGELLDQLPPFKEWWTYIWKEKETIFVDHMSGTKSLDKCSRKSIVN